MKQIMSFEEELEEQEDYEDLRKEMLDEDGLSPEEEAFMRGYDEAEQ